MKNENIYKQYSENHEINGVPTEIEITIGVEQDDIDPSGDFDFGDEQENARYLARFHSGELFSAVISVRATAPQLPVAGFDSLGACHIHTGLKMDQDIEDIIKEYAMVQNAIDNLKADLQSTISQIKPYIK